MISSSSPADASTYAHFLFNAFDSASTGSIKFEVCLIWHIPTILLPIIRFWKACFQMLLSFPSSVISFFLWSPSGLCDSSVHPIEGISHGETTVDLQPLWHQQRWIYQQGGVFVNMCMLEPHYFSSNSDLHILIVFCLSLTSHLNCVCVCVCVLLFCFTGDDRHRKSNIWHDGEVHLPCLENWSTQTACGCLLSGNSPETQQHKYL